MAETDLSKLLADLTVTRHPGVWAYGEGAPPAEAIFTFQEREGPCFIAAADADTAKDNRWVWLELAVYSDLHAVGFLAAVAQALATAGVPCNAIAALHHDHIFVPEDLASRAIAAIGSVKRD